MNGYKKEFLFGFYNVIPEFCTQIGAMNTLLQFYIFVAAFHD